MAADAFFILTTIGMLILMLIYIYIYIYVYLYLVVTLMHIFNFYFILYSYCASNITYCLHSYFYYWCSIVFSFYI